MLNNKATLLYHNQDILIIQTNACEILHDAADKNNKNSYGGFNLGLHVNDNATQVLSNRSKLLSDINYFLLNNSTTHNSINPSINSIHWLNQIHSNQVVCTDDSLTLTPPSADALIANNSQTALAIMTADCVPIVLYHPVRQQIAAIHAGWKGLSNGIIGQTIDKLNDSINDSIEDSDHTTLKASQSSQCSKNIPSWKAWLGTCICQACYEVSIDVVDKVMQGCDDFFNSYEHLNNHHINSKHLNNKPHASINKDSIDKMDISELRKNAIYPHTTDKNKAWLDLVAIATAQLRYCGVDVQKPESNNNGHLNKQNQINLQHLNQNLINDLEYQDLKKSSGFQSSAISCSYADSQYYSYRRMTHQKGSHTGRMALLIMRL